MYHFFYTWIFPVIVMIYYALLVISAGQVRCLQMGTSSSAYLLPPPSPPFPPFLPVVKFDPV